MKICKRQCRGTIISYFLVLIAVLTTGLVATMSLAAGKEGQIASMTLKRDQCFYAAEAGIQRAYWILAHQDGNWRADSSAPLTGNIYATNGNVSATYAVTAVGDWDSPVLVTATGNVPSTGMSVTVTAVATPNYIVPAITLGNNFDNSGVVVINGDVQAKGSISTSGRLTENGSLYAGGTITTHGSVDISGDSHANHAGITVPPSVFDTVAAKKTQTIHVPPGSHGNGTTVSSVNLGNGGIVYFDGPVTFQGNVSITGYGTIVVNGDVTIKSAASFGSSSSPANANIVTSGNLNVNGYLGVVGSIYVDGVITKSGGLDVTGIILGQQDLNTNGGMTITRARPPNWDPRYDPSDVGAMTLSRITGPIF